MISVPGVPLVSSRSTNDILTCFASYYLFTDYGDSGDTQLIARPVDMISRLKTDKEASARNFTEHAAGVCVHMLICHVRGTFISTVSRKGISTYCFCLNGQVLSRALNTYVC